jgi:putative DNA-invertase from lambdoid prophage Rac
VKAVVYLRVSTHRQDVASQRDGAMELCHRNGWEPVLIEETMSGARVRRPGWDRVMAMAIGREIEAVVVSALDRIGRSMIEVFNCVEALDKSGVRLLSVKEPWVDFASAPGGVGDLMRKLMLAIMSWAAELERERLLARSQDGTDQARKEGRIGGRPRKALVGEGLALAVRLHQAGQSVGQIQKALFERGYHRPLKEGSRAKPKPLARSTIHSAVNRLTLFDGLGATNTPKATP